MTEPARRTLLCPRCGALTLAEECVVHRGFPVLEFGVPKKRDVADAAGLNDDYEVVRDARYTARLYCVYCDWSLSYDSQGREPAGSPLQELVNEALRQGSGLDTIDPDAAALKSARMQGRYPTGE